MIFRLDTNIGRNKEVSIKIGSITLKRQIFRIFYWFKFRLNWFQEPQIRKLTCESPEH